MRRAGKNKSCMILNPALICMLVMVVAHIVFECVCPSVVPGGRALLTREEAAGESVRSLLPHTTHTIPPQIPIPSSRTISRDHVPGLRTISGTQHVQRGRPVIITAKYYIHHPLQYPTTLKYTNLSLSHCYNFFDRLYLSCRVV